MQNIEIEMDRTTGSTPSTDSVANSGELNLLVSALDVEEETPPLTKRQSISSLSGKNDDAVKHYGGPLSEKEAKTLMPPGAGGIIRKSLIIPDEFTKNGKLMKGLNPRDFNIEDGTVKSRRASLLITQSDFFSCITKIDDEGHPRYIWHGVLNGTFSLIMSLSCEVAIDRTVNFGS